MILHLGVQQVKILMPRNVVYWIFEYFKYVICLLLESKLCTKWKYINGFFSVHISKANR